MTDNFDLITPLLEFRNEDDFYFVQIIQRKKDHKKGQISGTNNHSRLIRSYQIRSVDYLLSVKKEIVAICDALNARAGIDLNRRSYRKTAFHCLKKTADQIMNEDYIHVNKAYDSVCGQYSNEKENKKWILDVDNIGRQSNDIILFAERKCEPIGRKFIAVIPSKNGYHIIMNPFNLKTFQKQFPDIEIHKSNPTNLYIP